MIDHPTDPMWNITRRSPDDVVFVDAVRGLIHERPDGSVSFTDESGAIRSIYAPGAWEIIERVGRHS